MFKRMVGTTRFELAASSTPRKRSTKLSYVPNSGYYTDLFASCQGITDKNEVRQVSDLFLSQSFCVICFIRRSAPISTPVSRATCSMVRPARRRARALLMDSSSCATGCTSYSGIPSASRGSGTGVCCGIGAGGCGTGGGGATGRACGCTCIAGCMACCGCGAAGIAAGAVLRICSRRMD